MPDTSRTQSRHKASATRSSTPSTAPERLHEWLSGERGFDEAMATYQRVRDEQVAQIFEFTTQLATLDPPPEPMQQLLRAVAGNQDAMDEFAGVFAGTVSPATFLSPDHVATLVRPA